MSDFDNNEEIIEQLNSEEYEEIPPEPIAPEAPSPYFTEAEGGEASDAASAEDFAREEQVKDSAEIISQTYYSDDADASTARVLAIISLVAGIISLVCCCFAWMSLVLAITAIVCGIISMKKSDAAKGLAIAGLVCGIIGAFLGLSTLVFSGLFNLMSDSIINVFNNEGIDVNEFF